MQADVLRQARKRARMTQAHLAQAAEISEKTVRRAEAGTPVSDETYRALCSVLGLGAQDAPSPEAMPSRPPVPVTATPVRPTASTPFLIRGCRCCLAQFMASGLSNYVCGTCKVQARQYGTDVDLPISDRNGTTRLETPWADAIGPSIENLRANAAVTRGRVGEATPEFAQELATYEGDVLTAPGGVVEVSPSRRRWVAMLGNRLLVVSKSHAFHHDVASVRSFLRRRGIVWRFEYHVDLPVIRAIYGNAERRRNGATPL